LIRDDILSIVLLIQLPYFGNNEREKTYKSAMPRGLREGRTGATKDQRDAKARRYYLEW
jgi:hypothetical protein